jgi:transketolase
MDQEKLDQLCVNTIRMLSADAVEKANSGHPGMPMGDAPMAYILWDRFMKYNPANPRWANRDRFVLSAGHGSMLLYSLLHLTGFPLSLNDIKQFRQWESLTPGHPEHHPECGIETTTGPLGQGVGNGVGMAMAEAYLAEYFNRPGCDIVDHYTYAITSDGDLMEGIAAEAASLAGHLGLGKLIYLYSDNKISIEGSTDLTFTEDVAMRFTAYGWHIQKVDGNDLGGLAKAIKEAQEERKKPSLILARTHIGFGSPQKQDTADAHGAPLGEDEVRLTKENLGWPLEPTFHIPEEALGHFRKAVSRGKEAEQLWQETFITYAKAHPDLAEEWQNLQNRLLPSGWEEAIPSFNNQDGPMATRSASGKVLSAVATKIPMLIGGSADLAPSNNTYLKGMGEFGRDNAGRNIHFGVREHAMGAVMNGMALSGLIPYGGTFLIFSDYMRPSIRLAALMKQQAIYVFTHDSIGLGEDGPTHQPVEHLCSLRAIPNLKVIRPGDANETAWAWKMALENRAGPVVLALTRQKLPVIDRSRYASAEGTCRGGYVLADAEGGKPELILLSTGSEVDLTLQSFEELSRKGAAVRVVSMPCFEVFDEQPAAYRDSVLPPKVRARVAVEAAVPLGWHKYVGTDGEIIGLERFGASAPGKTNMEKLGFSVENVVSRARSLLKKF